MRWFLATIRVRLAAAIVVALGVVAGISRDFSIVVPTITGGSPFGAVPLNALTPLLLIVLIGLVHDAAAPLSAQAAGRPLPSYFIVSHLVLASLFLIIYLIVTALLFGAPADEVVRNTCGYLSVTTAASYLLNMKLAPMVPVIFVLISAVFGRDFAGNTEPWAWPVHSSSSIEMSIAIIVAVLISLYAIVRPPSLGGSTLAALSK